MRNCELFILLKPNCMEIESTQQLKYNNYYSHLQVHVSEKVKGKNKLWCIVKNYLVGQWYSPWISPLVVVRSKGDTQVVIYPPRQ